MFLKSWHKNTIFILLSFTFLVKFTEDAENLSLFYCCRASTLQINKEELLVSPHFIVRKPTCCCP